jgi:hypothetical protein
MEHPEGLVTDDNGGEINGEAYVEADADVENEVEN